MIFKCSLFILFLLLMQSSIFAANAANGVGINLDNNPNPEHLSSSAEMTRDTVVFSFHFRRGVGVIDQYYKGNQKTLADMGHLVTSDNISNISTITIIGSTSPDGSDSYNKQLAKKRAESVRNYITSHWGSINPDSLRIIIETDNLNPWIRAVQNDANVPKRERVLEILNKNMSVQEKWTDIKWLIPEAGTYMEQITFPQMRTTVACVVTMVNVTPKEVTVYEPIVEVADSDSVEIEQEVDVLVPYEPSIYHQIRPIAVKTNMLFDLVTVLNVELEAPLAPQWSIMGEWTFPWWLWNSKQYCLEVLSANFEARYWFNPNYSKQDESLGRHNPLSGWFIGVYGGWGLYDVEWDKKDGYQGEFWSAGITSGYALPLSRNFGMEFSLGFGYLGTNWKRYTPIQDTAGDWHLTCHSNGQTNPLFIPTKAKISLVWYPHIKKKRR